MTINVPASGTTTTNLAWVAMTARIPGAPFIELGQHVRHRSSHDGEAVTVEGRVTGWAIRRGQLLYLLGQDWIDEHAVLPLEVD